MNEQYKPLSFAVHTLMLPKLNIPKILERSPDEPEPELLLFELRVFDAFAIIIYY
jgi:hypothetical protein